MQLFQLLLLMLIASTGRAQGRWIEGHVYVEKRTTPVYVVLPKPYFEIREGKVLTRYGYYLPEFLELLKKKNADGHDGHDFADGAKERALRPPKL